MSLAPQPHTQRNQAIEGLRVLAAFAIVAFHAQGEGYRWFYSGLVVFLFLSAMFAMAPASRERRPRELALRLLVPFAFWSVVYGALNLALGRPLFVQDHPASILLAGTSFHLWFLPFIALVLAVLGVLRKIGRPALVCVALAFAGGTLLASAPLWFEHIWQFAIPFPQWLRALPAVLLGAATGLLVQSGSARQAALLAMIAGVALSLLAPLDGFTLPYALGLGVTALAVAAPRIVSRGFNLQPLSDNMLGVYCVHIIGLGVAARLVERGSMAQVVLAFVLSLAGVWLARRLVPHARFVLG